jgi:dTDP-4-amino-4,6-dideoxygalactose transaminase
VFPQVVREDVRPVVHVYAAYCAGRRDELLQALEQAGIQANVYYHLPLYRQRGFQASQDRRPSLPVVEDVTRRIVALPFYPEIDDSTLSLVADAVTRFFRS